MGIVTSGIPAEITLRLAEVSKASVFIETGTYLGGTTKWASQYFDAVYTVERAENLYREHHQELSAIKGVRPLLGDSRRVLPSILAEVGQRSAVVWLDGHWSCGNTAGAGDECPLLDELACLKDREQDLILIDDARLFLCAPPRPHNPSQWPTISDLAEVFASFRKKPFIQIVDDVVFAISDEAALKETLISYAQVRSDEFWRMFTSFQGR